MSSMVSAVPTCVPPVEGVAGSEAGATQPLGVWPAFAPRRSRLVSWPVRVAQAADRVVARALPSRELDARAGRGLAEITLAGFDQVCRLVPSHQEVVLAERARLSIRHAITRRAERHRRFSELRRAMTESEMDADSLARGQLFLNPANCWIRWAANGGADGARYASSALFFLDGDELRAIRMRLEDQVLINELADYEPCTVAQWAALSTLVDHTQLTELVRHLVAIGLVAHS